MSVCLSVCLYVSLPVCLSVSLYVFLSVCLSSLICEISHQQAKMQWSRLPTLARVLLCLVRVGVPRVSWAIRYLNKLRWRAVAALGRAEVPTGLTAKVAKELGPSVNSWPVKSNKFPRKSCGKKLCP